MHNSTKWRVPLVLLSLTGLFLALCLGLFDPASPAAQAKDVTVKGSSFYSQAFLNTWLRTDYPVAAETAVRSWYWGPQPSGPGFIEPYADSPNGTRLVQYFDKARMEINNPTKAQVTNGLLVVELMNGKLQKGDYTFENRLPARIPVAGDLDNTFPTYSDLNRLYNQPQARKIGDNVTQLYQADGTSGVQANYSSDTNTAISDTENSMGIPAAFWNYVNQKGQIFSQGSLSTEVVSDWRFSTGLPITEAFWTRVKVAGVIRDVMVQAFERRILTYTPTNDKAFQVEMGNVGAAYLQWRYNGKLPAAAAAPNPAPVVPLPPVPTPSPVPSDPLTALFTGPHPQWYTPTGTLNVRTAPNSEAPLATYTPENPYIQRLQAGDHVLVLRTVKGEEIEKGNDNWFQIYESPDLFVYSAYTAPVTLPDFPTPPQTFKGLWVAVSINSQMMAVYSGSTLLYKTFIASGRPGLPAGDPEKDHSTPKGVFHIDGSWRPAVQEMKGGAGDKASGGDFYDIKDIRNVNYFYQDYSIHGTYWHAKFGIAPQSHGCANATVYDAGLIFKLPAGTVVQVF